jgi:hypothetical protein
MFSSSVESVEGVCNNSGFILRDNLLSSNSRFPISSLSFDFIWIIPLLGVSSFKFSIDKLIFAFFNASSIKLFSVSFLDNFTPKSYVFPQM